MKINGKVIQWHHTQYSHRKDGGKRESVRDLVLPLYMHEHRLISLIQRLNPSNSSTEFWCALEALVALNKPHSTPLREKINENS